MNKEKPRRYVVVLAYSMGMSCGDIHTYFFKYVGKWAATADLWGTKFEITPEKSKAVRFDATTALDVARVLRTLKAASALVMVEEA